MEDPTNGRPRRRWWRDARVIAGVATWVGAWIVSWLLYSFSSPFHDYFLWHVGIPNLWAQVTVWPYVIAGVLSGNLHGPNEVVGQVVFFLFFFWIGFFVAHLAFGAWMMFRNDR